MALAASSGRRRGRRGRPQRSEAAQRILQPAPCWASTVPTKCRAVQSGAEPPSPRIGPGRPGLTRPAKVPGPRVARLSPPTAMTVPTAASRSQPASAPPPEFTTSRSRQVSSGVSTSTGSPQRNFSPTFSSEQTWAMMRSDTTDKSNKASKLLSAGNVCSLEKLQVSNFLLHGSLQVTSWHLTFECA